MQKHFSEDQIIDKFKTIAYKRYIDKCQESSY